MRPSKQQPNSTEDKNSAPVSGTAPATVRSLLGMPATTAGFLSFSPAAVPAGFKYPVATVFGQPFEEAPEMAQEIPETDPFKDAPRDITRQPAVTDGTQALPEVPKPQPPVVEKVVEPTAMQSVRPEPQTGESTEELIQPTEFREQVKVKIPGISTERQAFPALESIEESEPRPEKPGAKGQSQPPPASSTEDWGETANGC